MGRSPGHYNLALGMALAAGLMRAQEPSVDEEVTAQEDMSAALTVGWIITVQGRLTDASGSPINGDRTIRASLYDSSTGGTQLYTYSTSAAVRDVTSPRRSLPATMPSSTGSSSTWKFRLAARH